MLTYNRLNVTLIKKDPIPPEAITVFKERLKEMYNTDKIVIMADFGDKDVFVVFDEQTLKTIISC